MTNGMTGRQCQLADVDGAAAVALDRSAHDGVAGVGPHPPLRRYARRPPLRRPATKLLRRGKSEG
jgi:hypothetical protein